MKTIRSPDIIRKTFTSGLVSIICISGSDFQCTCKQCCFIYQRVEQFVYSFKEVFIYSIYNSIYRHSWPLKRGWKHGSTCISASIKKNCLNWPFSTENFIQPGFFSPMEACMLHHFKTRSVTFELAWVSVSIQRPDTPILAGCKQHRPTVLFTTLQSCVWLLTRQSAHALAP